MGDSYTEGMGLQSPEREGWAYVAAGLLGLNPRMDSIAGTGFAWGGGARSELGLQFSVRLQDIADQKIIVPDVIILQGGQNDALLRNDAQVTDAVVATVAQAKKLWPDVQVLIMGPTAPEPLAASLKQTNAAVQSGATVAGVPFIDASDEQWFTPQNSGSYYADGAHVNAAGHKVIAEHFATHWRTLTT